MKLPFDISSRKVLARLFYGSALLILALRFVHDGLVHDLGAAIRFTGIDNTYWLLMYLQIPQAIAEHSTAAIVFDVLLAGFSITAIFLHRKWWVTLPFSMLWGLYFVIFNIYTGHHYHGLVGVLVMSVPFWFKKNSRFMLVLEGARYYFCFVFASAAIWKLSRGAIFHADHMANILKEQHVAFLVQNPNHWRSGIISTAIENPGLAHAFLLAGFAMQLSFLIGFFTKRLDWLLFLLACSFHLTNFLLMQIMSAELLVFNIALFPWIKLFSRPTLSTTRLETATPT